MVKKKATKLQQKKYKKNKNKIKTSKRYNKKIRIKEIHKT